LLKRNGELRDSRNVALTQALFYETRTAGIDASYTTKPEDYVVGGVTYLSLKKIYLDCLDPTEETFVQRAFDGNWSQWERIKKSLTLINMFPSEGVDTVWHVEWRHQLETKLRSLGVKTIVNKALDDTSPKQYEAAKWLAEGGWSPKRGRPSREEVIREVKRAAEARTNPDVDRMADFEDKIASIHGKK